MALGFIMFPMSLAMCGNGGLVCGHVQLIINIPDVLLWQCVAMTGLFVVMSYVQRDFSTALSGKDTPGFYKAIWKFVGIIIIAAPLYAYYHYMQVLHTTRFSLF